jgi:hypothetical protein
LEILQIQSNPFPNGALEHLQQLFQNDYKVKFSSFYGILVLQQLLQNENFLTIRYSELSYMKVTVAPATIILFYFLSLSLPPPLCRSLRFLPKQS